MSEKILEVQDLSLSFSTVRGKLDAIRDLSFTLNRGEILGIVGESGSGKSVSSLAIMGLMAPNAQIDKGDIYFKGQSLLKMNESERQEVRGKRISMIFQDPMTSLNPSFTVEFQLAESLRLNEKLTRSQCREKCIDLLNLVGIPAPEKRLSSFPHELSGGMSQRVMIAMAIASNPDILIADEPTTALDVTIQAQILELLHRLNRQRNMSIILISHDIAVISQFTDNILVMYAGEKVEKGKTEEVIKSPRHPYSKGLLDCLPENQKSGEELPTIKGIVPDLVNRPQGCQLHPRCEYMQNKCKSSSVPMASGGEREVRCHFPLESQ